MPSKPEYAMKKKIVTPVTPKTFRGRTPKRGIINPSPSWEVTILVHGTDDLFTFSAQGATEQDREWLSNIGGILSEIMVKKSLPNLTFTIKGYRL